MNTSSRYFEKSLLTRTAAKSLQLPQLRVYSQVYPILKEKLRDNKSPRESIFQVGLSLNFVEKLLWNVIKYLWMERPESFLIKSLFVCCWCSEAQHKARPIFHYCMTWGEALWSVSCEPAQPVPRQLGWLEKQTLTINQVEQRLRPGAGVRPNFEPNKATNHKGLTQWDYCQAWAQVIGDPKISRSGPQIKSRWDEV